MKNLNNIEIIKEGLTQTFSNDPIIWGKWLLVFGAFVLLFIVSFKLDKKVNPFDKLDKKIQNAIQDGHVIQGKLIKYWYRDKTKNNVRERIYHGTYEYEIDGEKYKYYAYFSPETTPPRTINLYYNHSPKKLFSKEEQHYYGISGLPALALRFLPFIVGALMVGLLGLAG